MTTRQRSDNVRKRTLNLIQTLNNNPLMIGSSVDLSGSESILSPKFVILNYEQEIIIKRTLIKKGVSEDFSKLKDKPSIFTLQNTVFLGYLYQKLILNSSRFQDSNSKALKEDIDKFLLYYPNLISSIRRSTGRKLKSNLIASLYSCGIITSIEKQNITSKEGQNPFHKDTKFDHAKRVEIALQMILYEMEHDGSEIFSKSLQANPLPVLYQTFFSALVDLYSIKIQEKFQDSKYVLKVKNMIEITPLRSLLTILKVSHSVTLISAILSLLTSKPFGFQSLLQKLFEITLDLPKTHNQVKNYHKMLNNKSISDKIINWIQANYKPDLHDSFFQMEEKTLLILVLADPLTKPNFENPEEILEGLCKSDKFGIAFNLLNLEIRNFEKQSTIEFLGDSELIRVLKEVLPVFYEPFAKLLYHGNLSKLVENFFTCMSECIEIAGKKIKDSKKELKMYVKSFKNFSLHLIDFLREIATAEPTLQNFPKTLLEFFHIFSTNRISLEQIMSTKSEKFQKDTLEEVEKIVESRRYSHLFFPETPNIDSLYPQFIQSLPISKKNNHNN